MTQELSCESSPKRLTLHQPANTCQSKDLNPSPEMMSDYLSQSFSWPHQEGTQKWKSPHATLYSITKQSKAKKITLSKLWKPEKNTGRHKWNYSLLCRSISFKCIFSKGSFMERIATQGREGEMHDLKPLNLLLWEIMLYSCNATINWRENKCFVECVSKQYTSSASFFAFWIAFPLICHL